METYLERYGIVGLIKLSFSLIRTKLILRNARIVRFPFYLRGKRFISIGPNFTTGVGCRIEASNLNGNDKVLFIGKSLQINDYVHIGAVGHIHIGDNVLIASRVFITDHDHGFYGEKGKHDNPEISPNKREISYSPVVIQNNVWIGENVSVLKGVTIGKGAIVGANSVVTKSIPNYTIAVGSPAKVIKVYNFEKEEWEKIE